MKEKDLKLMVRDMGVLLEEEIIPHMMKREYWSEMSGFGTWEAFECMEDQVSMLNSVVELFVFLSESDLRCLCDDE